MADKNWLFYSKNCDDSKHLISIMNSEKLLIYFHQVCVDDNPNLRDKISTTPTLMIKNIPYCGGDSFKWISKIKQWKISVQLKNASQKQQQYMNSVNNNLSTTNTHNNILEFSKNEMSDGSDLFAYLHNESATPRSYVNYDNIGNENIFTPPLEDGSYKINRTGNGCKLNKKQHTDRLKQLQEDRTAQSQELNKLTQSFKTHYTN